MVSGQQRRSLEYFKNKFVTFFVGPINRQFDEQECLNYFLGKVVQIDESGIWYEHTQKKLLSFIFFEKIISIAEEKFVLEEKTGDVDQTPPESMENINSVPQTIDELDEFLS